MRGVCLTILRRLARFSVSFHLVVALVPPCLHLLVSVSMSVVLVLLVGLWNKVDGRFACWRSVLSQPSGFFDGSLFWWLVIVAAFRLSL